ncbi:PP0621 family protein [Marinospirillum alkaliphilum]|uniref:TRASH domain-containing protein n=1 Tax=Marinospirillum alkaliphilum DSM 21637 TaxID=1122209 RepID=A0A1K1ZNN6_9GAMM|nr:PP0621 family protein [Marinospirillum alkaliphilum]SFX75866.1 uncharacterized protein SAMN02745752_02792 [Marinospirillum alkaliphilum DSM 21637]
MSLLIVRLVVFVLLFWAGWRLWQYWQQMQGSRVEDKTSDKLEGESMVPCAQCGVHLPKGSALQSGPRYFCCREHQEAFERNAGE